MDGSVTSNNDEINDIFQKFYSDLYSDQVSVDEKIQAIFINCLNDTLRDIDVDSPGSPTTLAEIKLALCSKSGKKSLPYEFYMSFLDILG